MNPIVENLFVVSVDLVRYGAASEASAMFSPEALMKYVDREINEPIEQIVAENKLSLVGLIQTGDGALLFFRIAADAVTFCMKINRLSAQRNLKAKEEGSNHATFFRAGVAKGAVAYRNDEGVFQAVGTAINRAVRIEQKCKSGSLLVEVSVYNALSGDLMKEFEQAVFRLEGKQHEKYQIKVKFWDSIVSGDPDENAWWQEGENMKSILLPDE